MIFNVPVFKMKNDFVPVSADFIERHMVKANGAYVKVYLYAALLAARDAEAKQTDIAENLNLLESDVKNALDYWRTEGLLSISSDTVTIEDITKTPPLGGKKTSAQIAKLMSEDGQLSELCILAQDILAKTISSGDMETLYWMYDELGFSADAILMILEYCASKDRRSVQYAEKVAVTWNERGINTVEAIDNYIKEEKNRNSAFYSLRRLFGIADRPLSNKEEEYLRKWNDNLKMGEEMVALAYEYCIMQTNKLSFPYMDTVITNWAAKDIRTVEAAEQEHSAFKSGSAAAEKSFSVYREDIDHSELERIMHEKYDG